MSPTPLIAAAASTPSPMSVILILLGVLALMVFIIIALIFIFYITIIFIRLKKREQISLEMVPMEVRLPKDNEIKVDAAEQFFASFASLEKSGFFSFFNIDDVLVFEIIGKKAEIKFYVYAPAHLKDYLEKQIYAYYPTADVRVVDEPNIFTQEGKVAYASLKLKSTSYYPVRTFKELPTDSIASITSSLSRMNDGEGALIQILIRASNNKWKKMGKSYISTGTLFPVFTFIEGLDKGSELL